MDIQTKDEANQTDSHIDNVFKMGDDFYNGELYQQMKEMEEICLSEVISKPPPNDVHLYCNATFDGWGCWNYTIAGTRAYGECPLAIFPHKVYGRPFKDCGEDGSWWRHPDSGEPWSNYTPCEDSDSKQKSMDILYVYFAGYSVSILLLAISLCLFSFFRQLHCVRVSIHKHLFVSYIMTGILWIMTYGLIFLNPYTLINNPLWCRLLHVATQYITTCNYAWMFCEGYYLHSLIVIACTDENKLLHRTYIIGWVFPIFPVAIYSGIRACVSDFTNRCWTDVTVLNWIITGPIACSLVVNLFFLLNITRILFSKFRSISSNESHQTRRAVRATLIIVPLLGLQYLLIPVRPTDKQLLYAYDIITAVVISFQGAFVSLLFCLLNGQILNLIRRKITQLQHRIHKAEIKRNEGLLDNHCVNGPVNANNSNDSKELDEIRLQVKVLYCQRGKFKLTTYKGNTNKYIFTCIRETGDKKTEHEHSSND